MDKPIFDPSRPQIIAKTPDVEKTPPVKTWSASSLKKFEECPFAVFLRYVQKMPEKESAAADRGSMIHELAEKFVEGELTEPPKELAKVSVRMNQLRKLYEEGKVTVEEDWGFDIDWAPAPWTGPTTWGRAKLDAFIRFDETCGEVVDHKTGKKFGNEIAHTTQGMIYAIAAFMRFPELEFINVRFIYIDQGEEMEISYTRENAMVLLPRIKQRALALTTCTTFRPKPGPQACKWCSYKENCDWAYGG